MSAAPPERGDAPPIELGESRVVYRSDTNLDARYIEAALQDAGIPCAVESENGLLAGPNSGMFPVRVRVFGPEHWPQAEAIVARLGGLTRASPSASAEPAWRCAACGQSVEGQFSACWKCGAERAAAQT